MTEEKITTPKIVPSLSGKELVHHPEIKRLLLSIKNLISCPNKIYERLYLTTIWDLAEFCQAMPYSENEFNEEHGFLMRQLKLAHAALKLRRGILFPKNATAESIAAEEAQWTYAIFTASLMKNLYQLQENREVSLYQPQKGLTEIWLPEARPLYKKAYHYSMRFTDNSSLKKRNVLMAALSNHIFLPVAVNWLSANTYLFKLWQDVVLHQSTTKNTENEIEKTIQLAANKIGIVL
jgi:hypothetical protein